MSLKEKTINSLSWSFIETIGNQGFQFIIGIILARLLIPEDFGLIGVLAIFIGLSGVMVDSGFKTSIIRSQDVSEVDCSTIFYINLFLSVFVSLLLFVSSNSIAEFFQKPELTNITRVLSLIPLLNGLGLVQSALLFKNLQFKRNAVISIISNVISGSVAIFLAFKGYSYWALIWKAILSAIIYNFLLWVSSTWRPKLIFSFEILKKHFKFSYKLLLTGLLDSFFDNIYSFIFGKFFSFKELGFFTRGKGYVDLITKTISVAIQKVNTPILAVTSISSNNLIEIYTKILRTTCLIVFPLSILLIVVSNPLVLVLIGDKWLPSVPFLQILAISGMVYPIGNSNSSLFEVIGRSDIILKIVAINRPIQILILFIMLKFGAIAVAWGIVLHQIVILYLSFYFYLKVTKQKLNQLHGIFVPALIISLLMGSLVYLIGHLLFGNISSMLILFIQTISGFIITLFLFYIFKIRETELIINFIINKLITKTKGKK